MSKRPFLFVFLLVLILTTPYFIYLPILFFVIIFIPLYWEGILLGFLIDALYGTYPHLGVSFYFPVGIVATLLVIILLPLRERIRLYNV